MEHVRVIARLDVKGPNVVKGVQFEALRVMGKPNEMAKEYFLQGADELIYLDVVASLYRRENLLHIVREASKSVFIPFTAGGGVRSLEDIHELLHAGAEKVAINTAAVARPGLITEAAERFGKQCVVVSIEAKKKGPGKWEVFTDNGRQSTGLDAIEWAKKAEELGAGEILLTSVDQEGTERGLDIALMKAAADAVSTPVIASGGASSEADIVATVSNSHVTAIAVASLLHYQKTTIARIKDTLLSAGIPVRKPTPDERKRETTKVLEADVFDYNRFTTRQMRDASLSIDPKPPHDVLEITPPTDADVSIVDYGINNIRSVFRAIEKVGKRPTIADSAKTIRDAKRLILPGVGAFAQGMKALQERGLIDVLIEKAHSGTPILGICLGMQLLFDTSEEFGHHRGLELIPGKVISFPDPKIARIPGYTLPNMGWNPITIPKGGTWNNSILEKVAQGESVYFVHSFYPVPENPSDVLAESEHGGVSFCAVVRQGNITATQFHTEKSGNVGIEMLRAFCENDSS